MSTFLKAEAIVIKSINLREADKIITLFSKEHGKIQGVAKGIRKIKTKYSGKLELFNRVRVIFFQKNQQPLWRITQADVVEVLPRLQHDFNKIIGASYVAEMLNTLFEEHDATHPAVYPLVWETLRTLAACEHVRNILPAFEIKLLAHLGYAPVLDRCTRCGTPHLRPQPPAGSEQDAPPPRPAGSIGFSSATGGVLCARCSAQRTESAALSSASLNILHQLLTTDMRQAPAIPMSRVNFYEIKHVLSTHFQYHLDVTLKTDAFVQKLRAAEAAQRRSS
jgi:DNA repair protein RecO (recombination protein O)